MGREWEKGNGGRTVISKEERRGYVVGVRVEVRSGGCVCVRRWRDMTQETGRMRRTAPGEVTKPRPARVATALNC